MRMDQNTIFCAGETAACRFAGSYLANTGLSVTTNPDSNIAHVLLDVPSFGANGRLRLGGDIKNLLSGLPEDITLYGGNLNHPALQNFRVVDFLKDESYLARNAYITAECALDVALPYLSVTVRECPVLIIGWGRIGKCLAKLLHTMGSSVTVAARKESDRAMLRALGYHALEIASLGRQLSTYRLVYNTVPHPVLSREQCRNFRGDCVLIDLASCQGIEHEDAVIARGLPGVHFPESSGKLIAETFLKYYNKEETS